MDVTTLLADLHDDIQNGRSTCRHLPEVYIRPQSIWPHGWATFVARLLWRLDTEAAHRNRRVEVEIDGRRDLQIVAQTDDATDASWLEPILRPYIRESRHRCRRCGAARKHVTLRNSDKKLFLSFSHDCAVHLRSQARVIRESPPEVPRHALLAVRALSEAVGEWRLVETPLGPAWRLPVAEGAREGLVTVYADIGRPYVVVESVAEDGVPLDGASGLPEEEAEIAARISRRLGLLTAA